MPDGVDMTDPISLGNDTLLDLLKTTLQAHPWDGKYEALQKYHRYPVCNQWMAKDRVTMDGGTSIVRAVRLASNGSAKFVLPYATSTPTVADVMGRLNVGWVKAQADYSIERTEMLRNRGKSKLINLVDTRRAAAMEDMANLLEEYSWDAPTSTTDTLHPLGVPYWLVPITGAQVTAATTLDGAFQGTHPVLGGSTASNCGGIDATQTSPDASRWKSWNADWTNSSGDLTDSDVNKISKMLLNLRFQGPVFVDDLKSGTYKNLRLYVPQVLQLTAEELLRKSNDSIGNDLTKFAGSAVVRNIPLEWNEQLDGDTSYPMFAINHDYFQPVVMEGDYLRETGPMNDRTQHDVFTTFLNLQFNFLCTNRQRAGGVISYVA